MHSFCVLEESVNRLIRVNVSSVKGVEQYPLSETEWSSLTVFHD